jgi:hypothetical protein
MIESCPYRQQICDLRLRCFTCRSYAEWRKYNNFPEVCPHGITAANLATPKPPQSQIDTAMLAQARGEVDAPPGRCKGCGG